MLIADGQAPHFARGAFDISSVGKEIYSQAQTSPAPVKAAAGGSAVDSPKFMIAVVLLIVSVLANLVLLAIQLTG